MASRPASRSQAARSEAGARLLGEERVASDGESPSPPQTPLQQREPASPLDLLFVSDPAPPPPAAQGGAAQASVPGQLEVQDEEEDEEAADKAVAESERGLAARGADPEGFHSKRRRPPAIQQSSSGAFAPGAANAAAGGGGGGGSGGENEEREEMPARAVDSKGDDGASDSLLDLERIALSQEPLTAEAREGRRLIGELRRELEREEIPQYDEAFEEEVGEEVMMIGSLPVEEVEKQERLIEQDRVRALRQDVQRHQERLTELARRERAARRELAGSMAVRSSEVTLRERKLVQRHLHHLKDEQDAFRKAEDRLLAVLHKQKGRIRQQFGVFGDASDVYNTVRGRRYQIDWSFAPRVLRIRIDLLRAVKNKLPRGRYVMMVTLYDRLGGHPVRWSKLEGVRWTGTTPYPRRHNGKFFDLELSFAQKRNRIFLACPSEAQARPSMVLLFELFLLRGRHSKVDRVVGWGAFPLCQHDFSPVQGRFKMPLLRGEVDPTIDKYERIEERISRDLDHWLCNVYFDVRHLPRYMHKQKEYEVELAFSTRLLQPRRRADEQGVLSDAESSGDEADLARDGGGGSAAANRASKARKDEDEDEADESAAAAAAAATASRRMDAARSGEENEDDDDDGSQGDGDHGGEDESEESEEDEKEENGSKAGGLAGRDAVSSAASAAQDAGGGEARSNEPKRQSKKSKRSGALAGPEEEQDEKGDRVDGDLAPPVEEDEDKEEKSADRTPPEPKLSFMQRLSLFRKPQADGYAALHLADSSGDAGADKAQSGGKAKPGESAADGRGERVARLYELPTKDAVVRVRAMRMTGGKMFDELAEWGAVAEEITQSKKKVDPVRRAKELERYKFSLVDVERDAQHSEAKRKLRFIFSEIAADYSRSRWKTLEFWASVLLLPLCFMFMLYIHSLGQFLFLNSLRIPVYRFDSHVVYYDLDYSPDNLQSLTEVGVTVMGTLSNALLFALCMCLLWMAQRLLGHFPDTVSRVMLVYGAVTIADPLLVLVIDLARRNWSGDCFKLYNHFEQNEGNGMPGVFLTVLLVLVLIVLCTFLFYAYLLRLHMNGRMLDVYYRINGDEASFFLPDDLEVSVRTLRWVLVRAKRWTGFHGATRKVAIANYVMRDHTDRAFEERTIHIAIYTQDLYGERELYRHFVRRPDGAILELFDSVELLGQDNFRKLEALLLASRGTDDELVAALNGRPVKGVRQVQPPQPAPQKQAGRLTVTVAPAAGSTYANLDDAPYAAVRAAPSARLSMEMTPLRGKRGSLAAAAAPAPSSPSSASSSSDIPLLGVPAGFPAPPASTVSSHTPSIVPALRLPPPPGSAAAPPAAGRPSALELPSIEEFDEKHADSDRRY